MASLLKPLTLTESLLDDFETVPTLKESGKAKGSTRIGSGARTGRSSAITDAHLIALRERQRAIAIAAQKESENRILQEVLPLWDDANRGVPNPFIRSGLFSVRKSDKREFIDITVASLSNYRIEYRGEELQQDDLTVWLSLINLARAKNMAESIFFTAYSLIKDIGWRMHSESYARAEQSIKRLKVTGLTISSPDGSEQYTGSLIREHAFKAIDNSGNSRWMVRFEPRISCLFMEDTTTLLEWETRKKIGTRATVALFLHSFYSSHRDPIPLSIGKLHELSRSLDSVSGFKRTLVNALETLVRVESLAEYRFVGDILHVTKTNRPRLATAKIMKAKRIA